MSYRAVICFSFVLITVLVGCSPATKAPVRSLSEETRKKADVAFSTYQVKAGDTLYSIAFRYGLNYRGLAAKNNITSPYRIQIGQRLILSDEVPAYSEVIQPEDDEVIRPSSPDNKQQTPTTKPKVTQAPKNKNPVRESNRDNQGDKARPSQSKSEGNSRFDQNVRVKQWMWPIANNKNYQKRPGNQLFFRVKNGTAVRAVADGRVVYSGTGLVGYGHLIIVKHSQNLLSAYAFNENILIKEKQQVKAGQQLSTSGVSPTGEVGLGFEIRSSGTPINALQYLK